ncbi:hypothetical protein BC829DRAFT_86905 [Chytridium lagenaria]|nr:hypothetical protein BC829DRAFT_86905 [Chytridium lagenaria]
MFVPLLIAVLAAAPLAHTEAVTVTVGDKTFTVDTAKTETWTTYQTSLNVTTNTTSIWVGADITSLNIKPVTDALLSANISGPLWIDSWNGDRYVASKTCLQLTVEARAINAFEDCDEKGTVPGLRSVTVTENATEEPVAESPTAVTEEPAASPAAESSSPAAEEPVASPTAESPASDSKESPALVDSSIEAPAQSPGGESPIETPILSPTVETAIVKPTQTPAVETEADPKAPPYDFEEVWYGWNETAVVKVTIGEGNETVTYGYINDSITWPQYKALTTPLATSNSTNSTDTPTNITTSSTTLLNLTSAALTYTNILPLSNALQSANITGKFWVGSWNGDDYAGTACLLFEVPLHVGVGEDCEEERHAFLVEMK